MAIDSCAVAWIAGKADDENCMRTLSRVMMISLLLTEKHRGPTVHAGSHRYQFSSARRSAVMAGL